MLSKRLIFGTSIRVHLFNGLRSLIEICYFTFMWQTHYITIVGMSCSVMTDDDEVEW